MKTKKKYFLGRSVARQQNMSEETARKVDSEIRKFVDMGLSLIHIPEPTRPY